MKINSANYYYVFAGEVMRWGVSERAMHEHELHVNARMNTRLMVNRRYNGNASTYSTYSMQKKESKKKRVDDAFACYNYSLLFMLLLLPVASHN